MVAAAYSLEDTVNDFFASRELITQQQCDEFAVSLIGGPVTPVPIQNASSYTVTAEHDPSKIVQFREVEVDPDNEAVDLARSVHGELVTSFTSHGRLGHSSQLSVYSTEKLPGSSCILARSQPNGPAGTIEIYSQRHRTVVDLALFYAESWNAPQDISGEAFDELRLDYDLKLDLLSRVLPARLQENLWEVSERLPLIFEPSHPMVLSHGNLSDLNIFINPSTGGITGIADWEKAKVRPFGISLWGLEHVLGFMTPDGWRYHKQHRELRNQFWRTFEDAVGGLDASEKEAIEIARMAGLYLRYGFELEGDDHDPVEEGSSSFMYLDAFCSQQAPSHS